MKLICVFLFLAVTLGAGIVDEVDPFIGSLNGGNTFPGALVPWGMVSLSPHNDLGNPSGYSHGKPLMFGFGHVHLSGVGCPDLGNIVLMPQGGDLKTKRDAYAALYDDESAKPGYYHVRLPAQGVVADMSASTRTGFSRYIFSKPGGSVRVLLDLGQAMQAVDDASLSATAGSASGWSKSGEFCGKKNKQTVYFYLELSPAARSVQYFDAGKPGWGAAFEFAKGTGAVLVKTGISYVSAENAKANLRAENPGWDFESMKAAAQGAWERELGRVAIKGGKPEQRSLFYTALYHALIHPNIFSDVNGEYQGMASSGVKRAKGRDQYTVFSLWDTYRTLHPLLTLLYPYRQQAMLQSMAAMSADSGWLPKWELAGNETYVMVGDPSVIVMADGYLKGLKDFDAEGVFKAAWKAAHSPGNSLRPGLASFLKHGYIAHDDLMGDWVWGSASSGLEYALADESLSRLALALGKKSESAEMHERAGTWRKYYDSQSAFIRPRLASGAFLTPFDPLTQCCDQKGWPDNGGPGYVEGNAWQYTWFVPHDMAGLIQAMGPANFVKKLQTCIDTRQFVMWNEPDMAYPWLFNYVPGESWRTRKSVREAALTAFKPGPSGLPGNDDCGTTSAWFIWAALGIYPDNPIGGSYQLGAPLFEDIALTPEGAAAISFHSAESKSLAYAKNIEYKFNGAPIFGLELDHSRLIKGGELRFEIKRGK